MDTSASLSKAVTEADKERYKKEGRCFFCGAQGHVSRSCSKKTATPSKPTPAKIATVAEDTTPASSVISQTTTLMQESVLNFLKDLPTDEYQQMAEAWGRLTTCYGFLYPYDMMSQLGTWACIWLLPHAVKETSLSHLFLTCHLTLSGSHDLTVM